MSDAIERARHATLLSAIAAQFGVPVSAFIEHSAGCSGSSHPLFEACELNQLFAEIEEPAARRRCLEYLRSVADEARARHSIKSAD